MNFKARFPYHVAVCGNGVEGEGERGRGEKEEEEDESEAASRG